MLDFMSAFAELLSQLLLRQLAQPEEEAASRIWCVLHFFHHSDRKDFYIYKVCKDEVEQRVSAWVETRANTTF